MKNQEQTNEGSRRDPESIRKEYKELKKASISYLRTEWSRSFRVGDPKGTDKTGLISDILRARHGNKHVDAAFESEVTEIRRSSVSGTMSGSVYSLEDRKYELKKDVKGARIGDFINVTLPKGTIIYNLPGGLFADHFSLKSRYTTPYGNGPKWLSQSWGQGVSIRQMPETLSSIEKNSKVLESVVTEKREDVGKYNTVKKVISKLGRRPSEQDLATFINNNYYDVTEVERGEDDPTANDKIADLVGFYKFDIDDWEIAWADAQNESVVNEAENYITDKFKVGDKIKTGFGEWEVIETDYAPGKSFIAPFIFKGKDIKRVDIPNPPKTNKNAVGYKVTDGAKYPIIGFLYQYKDITKLTTIGVDESVVTEDSMSDIDILAQEAKDFKSFVKEFTKEYKDIATSGEPKQFKEWLQSIYDMAKENMDESIVTEKVEKIACLECDEVNTKKAWEKNNGFCPSCKVSSKGVAESIITEAKAYKLKASEFGGDTHSAAYNVKGEPTWRVHSTYAIDQVSGENNPEERDVVFFEAMPINNDIYIKIGGINNLKRANGSTVGENFGTTIEEWKKDPKGIAKEASEFLTDATHLKWINKKARSEGQVIKWALKDDYSSVIEDLVNKSLGLSESVVTEAKYKAGDKWEWKTRSNSKVIKIIRVESNGDIIAKEDGKSQHFIVRDADKYLTKIINEAAKIETERYVRSHGKKPRGYGGWMFSYNRDGSDEWQIPNGMSWADAQKWAKKKAKEDGEDYVYVMESVVTEEVVYNSSNTKPEAAKKATKEFGNLLPKANKGVKPYVFAVVKTKARNYRLAIKSGSYVAHEFMSGLRKDGILTADIVKKAVANVIKMNPEEFNESVVTESKNSKEIKELEKLLKSIKSNTPAEQGRKASIQDDIERLKNEVVTEAKNTIGLAFKEEQDYLDFKEFVAEQPRGAIRKNIGFDSKTKSWNVEMDVKVLDSIYGEGTPSDKKSGWYGGLPDDFESVIIESVVTGFTEAKMTKDKLENLIYSLENENDSWHPSSDSKKKSMLDKLKKDLSKFESVIIESNVDEANKGKVHRAAKKGSYPAVIVVVQDGKVIHQEPVSTPEVAPATFNVMQEKYPKALLHLEDNTGKRLFSESVVNEASKDRMVKQIERALKDGMSIFKLPMATQKYYIKNKSDFEAVTEGKYTNKFLDVKDLHFEIDPKNAEEMKIELGKRQGELNKRKQIEGGEYSLRRFRKEIKYDTTGKDLGVFRPGSYMAATSTLGDGPHKKAVKKIKWTQKKYDQWLEDMAANGGADNAFDMAQNAKNETGLIDWVKKNFRGDDPLQRIQWDIEAFVESVVNEKLTRGLKPLLTIGSTITKKAGEDALLDLSDKFDRIDDEYAGTIASWLDMAIELMQDGYSGDATKKLKQFNKACKDVLNGKEVGSAFESVVAESNPFIITDFNSFILESKIYNK